MNTPAVEEDQGLGRKDLNRIVARFLALGDQRLARIRASLTHEQSNFFDLLPLLWHVNHAAMPGFASSDTPCGVAGFRPDRTQLLLARRYARGFKEERRHHQEDTILGLYLMGSMGSLGQTVGSDLDFWLCHTSDIDETGLAALRRKAALLEQYASDIGLHAHFFLMNADSFRGGVVEKLSKESSGHTQHTLLLEEFYRTGILLAGNPLLWWIVPPEQEVDYTRYTERLINKRFIRANQWLDFGGLHTLPADEFFGVAHWQLFKGIDAPYKSLLKLMLLEAYAAEYPKVNWLCLETKRVVYEGGDVDIDRVDPYQLILGRITKYFTERNELARLQLARRAFYFKAGQLLARSNLLMDWRRQQMIKQCTHWGWGDGEIQQLDTRAEWKLERVVEEREALISELSRSYRLLTEFAREQDAAGKLDTHELALLGRKLYAALDKRPGKVDRINPGISRDLSERTLWLRRISGDPARWQLFLHPPEEMPNTPVKACVSLVEILTWMHINGICERSTQVHYVPKPPGYGEPEQDKILKTLRKRFPRIQPEEDSLASYADEAHGKLSIWFINVGHNPLATLADAGYQLISERVDALSFSGTHECLVANIEHLYLTSWGEVRVERHPQGGTGLLDCLCRYLNLFSPHKHKPGSIAAYSFSSTRGGAIANRVSRLAQSVCGTFHQLGEQARYLVRISDHFYEIHFANAQYNWTPIGELEDLYRYLAYPEEGCVPTRIDRISMQDSPLPALLKRNEPGVIQLFYEVSERGIQLYFFDQHGAFTQQWMPGADEYHLLVHQRRFLDSVIKQRLLPPYGSEPAQQQEVRFTRIYPRAAGELQLSTMKVPTVTGNDYIDMVATTGPHCRLQDGFRLRLDNQTFDSRELGNRLYAEVAKQLRRLRRSNIDYPVYMTGMQNADPKAKGSCKLVDILKFKRQVEQRLAEAMRAGTKP